MKFTFLFLALSGCLAAADTYTNPVGEKPIVIGDPFVLQHEGTYYLFGTNAKDGFRYSTSKDLVHWTEGGYAWRREADSWSDPPYWAPEVKFYRGKFYMTYSGRVRGLKPARLLTALAVSDRPEGPYKDLYAPWFDPGYSVIDADILVDDDGTPYLYFSRNGLPGAAYSYGAVYGVQLTRDLLQPVGEPVKMLEASQDWERINWATNRCNEGPTVIRHNGKYLMTYSANNTGLPGYGVGVASSQAVAGSGDEHRPDGFRGGRPAGDRTHANATANAVRRTIIQAHANSTSALTGRYPGLRHDRVPTPLRVPGEP